MPTDARVRTWSSGEEYTDSARDDGISTSVSSGVLHGETPEIGVDYRCTETRRATELGDSFVPQYPEITVQTYRRYLLLTIDSVRPIVGRNKIKRNRKKKKTIHRAQGN